MVAAGFILTQVLSPTHDALMAAAGTYAELYDIQARAYR